MFYTIYDAVVFKARERKQKHLINRGYQFKLVDIVEGNIKTMVDISIR